VERRDFITAAAAAVAIGLRRRLSLRAPGVQACIPKNTRHSKNPAVAASRATPVRMLFAACCDAESDPGPAFHAGA
jgi:hypothetical protein